MTRYIPLAQCNIQIFENVAITDINECDVENTCDENAICINTYGSYKCQCKDGYSGSGYPGECMGKYSI